jgi:hypothetical protein
MFNARAGALALAMSLAAGCGSGATPPPSPPAAAQPQAALNAPAESSAARYILAKTGGTGRAPQHFDGDGDEDDGGWGTLQLPAIRSCGNGTFATDCAAWSWTSAPGGTRGAARTAQSITGTPPILSFCRDGAAMPLSFTPSAPVLVSGPSTFSLSYTGTKTPPIVSFATRWWNVSLTGTFTGTATTAPAMSFTPTLTDGAARGWLVFFTWSWPADVLLVPYAINEIQLDAGSSPLTVPRGGSAVLDAFDCLGRTIRAQRTESGFGFSPDLHAPSAASAGSELRATVFGGSNPNGFVHLSDDRGARTPAQIVPGPPPTR